MDSRDLLILLTAVALGAFVKSVTGLGMPLVATPLASIFVPQPVVIAVLAFPNMIHNFALMTQTRRSAGEVPGVAVFVGSGLVGAAVGAIASGSIGDRPLLIALAVIVALYLVSEFSPRPLSLTDSQRRTWRIPVGFVTGLFQGSVGISGPVAVGWYQTARLSRDGFVFAISTVFGLTGVIQVGVYAEQGRFNEIWPQALAVLVVVLATMPIGRRVRDRIPPERFRRIVVWLVFVTWIVMVAEGLILPAIA